ncbi:MAG TPA: VWA domain-containing protein [Pyrinomonadaceae bacterium]|nr:VWA domain-containing protein [Pyrinomonadaceae bacterium]
MPRKTFLLARAGLVLALLLAPAAARQSKKAGAERFLDLALPAGGEVSVENRRGAVEVEVWGEGHVALAASFTATKRGASPVQISRAGETLSVKVAAAARPAQPRVDLKLRVPATARLKVSTSEGTLEVRGLPASLSAQTLSGDLLLGLPAAPDASLTAQSLNGSVNLDDGVEAAGAAGRTVRGKFRANWGAGAAPVNLFSGRGRIRLSALPQAQTDTARVNTTTTSAPRQPRLAGAYENGPAPSLKVQQPAPAATPEEVDEDEVVRVESDLVSLNVGVADRASGRGLVGLDISDFRLYEDNVEQRIEHFESANAPFDLLLLLDLSGSTAKVTDTIRAAARSFVAATRPQDRIAVVAFAGETGVVSPLTADRRALYAALDRLARPNGDTRLYDAVAYAVEYLEREARSERRRAVVLMSDGLDSTMPNVTGVGSQLSFDEVRSRVQEFDGVFYTVWTSTEYEAFSPEDIQPETFDLAAERLGQLAAAGGGVSYEVERLEDLAGAYERVVADLGTVYTLSYRPTNKQRDGTWRAIRVRLPRHPEAAARGKRGYYAK